MKRIHVLAIAVVAWVLSIPGINLYHHLTLPEIDKYRIINKYELSTTIPFVHKHTDITLQDEIGNSEFFHDVVAVLRNASYGDTITFHLIGWGGQEDTMFFLINNVRASKAYVTMSVEAPVYSAHAYLAVSGDELVMAPYTYLMFHFSSVLNMDCDSKEGTDRGVSNIEHCNAFKTTDVDTGIKLLQSISLLTLWEKVRILTGHDVYITSDEYQRRIGQSTSTK